ncbi:MAG: PKD domain-containing protein [Methanospirillum sp.]|nr:PKD domain-containing protein [Methanospirillum sp.]
MAEYSGQMQNCLVIRLLCVFAFCVCIAGILISITHADGPEDNITNNTSNLSAEWVVDFTASPFEGYPPLCVQFTVSGPNGEYVWDFGDGTTSYAMNPVHCYKQKGSYWVKLKYSYGTIAGEVSKPDCVKVGDPEIYVDYFAEPSSGPAPLTTQFSIIGNPTNIIWHFGDGSDDSTDQNPRHQFREPGNYSPTLTYCIAGFCNKISKFNYIEVVPGDKVDFLAERQNGTAPICTRFIVYGEADSFQWDFGDGGRSYEKSPVHCYPEPGLYTVSMTYTIDGAPYTITKNRYLKYVPAGTPDFTATPVEGIAPLCVAYSIINPTQSWEFNFGDNSTATSAQATHCYGTSGNYFPSLTYCSNNLCDTVEGKEPILVHQPRILIAQGTALNEYKFSTDAPEGLKYSWDFGDGTRAEGPSPSHRFDMEGTYRVSLVITGTCGCNAIAVKELKIKPKEKLDFTATPLAGCAPHCVQFNEKSPEIPLTRLWDFGDGETSTEKNPFHCFRFPGPYTVSLTDTFPNGTQQEVKENYITAHAVPKPSFTMFPPHGDAPLTVKFTDTTIDYAEKRYWNFGDGTSDSGKIVEHRFDEPGNYNVTLTVWGAGDCFGTKSQTVHVLKKEASPYDFSGLPRRGLAPLCTSYKVTGQIQQSELDFGDGQKTNERNPFHCYETAGIYSPALQACDSVTGCEDIRKPAYIVAVSPYYLNITLLRGWNLVSVPVTLEPGFDTMDILSGVDTAGHSIFTWNSTSAAWMRSARSDPISPLSAFFVYSPDMVQVPIRISGEGPEYNLTRDLEEGWNLVSFADIMMVSADEAFRSIEEFWSYIIGYDAEKQRFSAPITNGVESRDVSLDPRQGYWIFMNSSAQMVGKQL